MTQAYIMKGIISTHAPAGGATLPGGGRDAGDFISTHAPAGGATWSSLPVGSASMVFLLTPLREGRHGRQPFPCGRENFYSRPCGRGDLRRAELIFRPSLFLLTPLREGRHYTPERRETAWQQFLLTPLREGRLNRATDLGIIARISTHAPAGGATTTSRSSSPAAVTFLLTPLREGRRRPSSKRRTSSR